MAARSPRVGVLAAAGAAATIAALAWLLWPASAPVQEREAAVAPAGSEAWMQRLEAERERQRQESQRSHDYLQRMAAADSALLGEMSARADALAGRSEAGASGAPVRTEGARVTEPTPREPVAVTRNDAPATGATGAATAPVAGPAPAPVARAPEAPVARPAPEPEPAKLASAAPPVPVAAADSPETSETAVAQAANCEIHVSELSNSGKLTYADVARMKGARVDGAGRVLTPPVQTADRSIVFEVSPDGCVRVARMIGR